MCSPQQAVGVPTLTDEIDSMRGATDRRLHGEKHARQGAVDQAQRDARRTRDETLARAGQRFGRHRTVAGHSGRQVAVRGTLG